MRGGHRRLPDGLFIASPRQINHREPNRFRPAQSEETGPLKTLDTQFFLLQIKNLRITFPLTTEEDGRRRDTNLMV